MTPPGRARTSWGAAALACVGAWLASGEPARAQHLDGYVEVGTTRSRDTTEVVDAEPVRTHVHSLVQRLNVTYFGQLWPNLSFQLGGFFERTASSGTQSDLPFDSTLKKRRPFARLRLESRTLRAEVGWDRNETRNALDGTDSVTRRDNKTATVAWRPDAENFVQVQSIWSDERTVGGSGPRRSTTTTNVDSVGRPTPWLTVQYRAAFETLEDKTEGSRLDTDAHTVRLAYSQNLWHARAVVNSDYNVTRLSTTQQARRGGRVDLRIFPIAGLSSIDDLPDRDPLSPNPALIDGNLTAGAAVDIGLQPTGDRRWRNIGVDLGVPQRVNLFRVWVDRELREEISRSFAWEIWISEDNDRWTFHRALSVAPFGTLENRFELEFEPVVARYLKVLVRPLDPAVPFATDFPVILITEIESFERSLAPVNAVSDTRTSQQYTLNTRVRLLESTPLFYDLSFVGSSVEGAGSRSSLTNGLSYSETLSDLWSVTARVANERAHDPGSERDANSVSASVSVTPLPTLSSNLFVGGRRETIDDEARDSASAVLSVNAALYRGVDLTASVGGSRSVEDGGRRSDATLVNVGAQIVPNRFLAFNALVQDNSREETGGGRPDVDDPNRAIEASVTINPVSTLYLYASRRVERRAALFADSVARRTLDNYSFSWSPFPYGTLRLSFAWNEYYDSGLDSVTTIWGPSLRWNLRSRSFFDLSYQKTTGDSSAQRFDRSGLFASLRIGF